MSNRRNFIKKTSIGVAGTFLSSKASSSNFSKKNQNSMTGLPIIISTWKHGYAANEKAYELIKISKNRITILAGGGVNHKNIHELYEAGVRQFHLSGTKTDKFGKSETNFHLIKQAVNSFNEIKKSN